MSGYYDDHLSAERLRRCYEIAPPRIRQYLQAEVDFVCGHLSNTEAVLELGCGYGRVLQHLIPRARTTFGIDTSPASLAMARDVLDADLHCDLARMNAAHLAFADAAWDLVLCIQNGISAFHEDPGPLFREAVRVTRPGGTVLVSTYSENIWSERLAWFQLQSEAGLLGEIDPVRTGNGIIVCRDGFSGRSFTADELLQLAVGIDAEPTLTEVDRSSLFIKLVRRP